MALLLSDTNPSVPLIKYAVGVLELQSDANFQVGDYEKSYVRGRR